jgi:uncharacterized RDD family membrane protein YckC
MAEKLKNDHKSYGETYELAGLVERLAANVIDNVVLIIPIMIIQSIIFSPEPPLPFQLVNFIFLAIPVAYHWYFWTRRDGQTPGKFALGIRVIKASGGQMNDIDAVIRAIGYHVSAMVFGLGFIWALFDKNNQTWHDKIARTYVVRTDDQRKTVTIDG